MSPGTISIAVPQDRSLAELLLARGRVLARHLGVEWIAIRIIAKRSDDRSRETSDLHDLVTGLGGRLVCREGRDIAAALIEQSSREQSRILVIGRSRRPRFLRRLKRGTTERILRAERPFDVVIATEGSMW